jgi:hypothetical protein
MHLHDPERIKKCLIAPQDALGDALIHALKTVSEVRSGQAGNIARGEVQSHEHVEIRSNIRSCFVF